jgi:hypothetical protein
MLMIPASKRSGTRVALVGRHAASPRSLSLSDFSARGVLPRVPRLRRAPHSDGLRSAPRRVRGGRQRLRRERGQPVRAARRRGAPHHDTHRLRESAHGRAQRPPSEPGQHPLPCVRRGGAPDCPNVGEWICRGDSIAVCTALVSGRRTWVDDAPCPKGCDPKGTTDASGTPAASCRG